MKLKKLNISTKSLLIIIGFTYTVLLVAGWFYWFQWRPTKIRQYCYDKTFTEENRHRESNEGGNKEWAEEKEWMANPSSKDRWPEWGWWYPLKSKESIEYLYATCLLKHGMKAEAFVLDR